MFSRKWLPANRGVEYTNEFGEWWEVLSEGELLIGGCKAGDKRFYEKIAPIADDLYDTHLEELRREGEL